MGPKAERRIDLAICVVFLAALLWLVVTMPPAPASDGVPASAARP